MTKKKSVNKSYNNELIEECILRIIEKLWNNFKKKIKK